MGVGRRRAEWRIIAKSNGRRGMTPAHQGTARLPPRVMMRHPARPPEGGAAAVGLGGQFLAGLSHC